MTTLKLGKKMHVVPIVTRQLQVEMLARNFTLRLLTEIGDVKLREVARINAKTNDGTCASHNFCDANVVMGQAFEFVFGRETQADSDEDMAFFNDAWDLAKARGFKIC